MKSHAPTNAVLIEVLLSSSADLAEELRIFDLMLRDCVEPESG
jgi:hypothetical protein